MSEAGGADSVENTVERAEPTDDAEAISPDLLCPICREIFVTPRVFECGHSICEQCHIEIDRHTQQNDVHTTQLYRCPVCRLETIRPYYRRPVNIELDRVAQQHTEAYALRKASYEAPAETRPVSKTIQLASMARRSRMNTALALYRQLMPLLAEAAGDGRSYLTITQHDMVCQAEKVMDLLSMLLFSHGVYRVFVNPGYENKELTVTLLKEGTRIRREYTNLAYSEGELAAEEEEEAENDEDEEQAAVEEEQDGDLSISNAVERAAAEIVDNTINSILATEAEQIVAMMRSQQMTENEDYRSSRLTRLRGSFFSAPRRSLPRHRR